MIIQVFFSSSSKVIYALGLQAAVLANSPIVRLQVTAGTTQQVYLGLSHNP